MIEQNNSPPMGTPRRLLPLLLLFAVSLIFGAFNSEKLKASNQSDTISERALADQIADQQTNDGGVFMEPDPAHSSGQSQDPFSEMPLPISDAAFYENYKFWLMVGLAFWEFLSRRVPTAKDVSLTGIMYSLVDRLVPNRGHGRDSRFNIGKSDRK